MQRLLLVLTFVATFAQEEKGLADVIQDVAATMGSPELKAALELIHTESSTSVSEIYEQTGFYSITNIFDAVSSVIDAASTRDLILFILDDPLFSMLPEIQKKAVARTIQELMMAKINNKKGITSQAKKFELQFSDGNGKILLFFISFTPIGDDELMYERYIIATTFEVAPPYVIVTQSDCNILSCDRTDSIVYMPARITDGHTATIINMNIGFMVGLSKQVAGNMAQYRKKLTHK